MSKDILRRYKLKEKFQHLLKTYPPTSPKNITSAFKEMIPCEISSSQWVSTYKEGATADYLADFFLNPPKTPRISNFELGMGQGGKRGRAAYWTAYKEAAEVLLVTDLYLKKEKISIDPTTFLALLPLAYKKELPHEYQNGDIKRFIDKALANLLQVINDAHKEFDWDNIKHRTALMYLTPDRKWTLRKVKGKKLSPSNISRGIGEVTDYLYGDDNIRRDKDFYKNKKVYYLLFYSGKAHELLFNLKAARLEAASAEKIQSILSELSTNQQSRVLTTLLLNLWAKRQTTFVDFIPDHYYLKAKTKIFMEACQAR